MEEGAELKDTQEVESERASNTSDCSPTPWIEFLKPLNNTARLVSVGRLSADLQACEVKGIKSVTFASALVSLVPGASMDANSSPSRNVRACGGWVGISLSKYEADSSLTVQNSGLRQQG